MAKAFDAKAAAARSLGGVSAPIKQASESFEEFKKRVLDVPYSWPLTKTKVEGTAENGTLDALYRAIRNLSVRSKDDTLLLNVLANFAADVSVDLRSLLVLMEKKEFAAAEIKLRDILAVEAGPYLSPEQRAYYQEAIETQKEQKKKAETAQEAALNKAREFGKTAART